MSLEELQKIISPKFTAESLSEIATKATGSKNAEIKTIKIEDSSTKKGDSYLSDICRFTITIKNPKAETGQDIFVPVIAKFLPKNLARRKTLRSTEFFKNEGIFYNELWPVFEKFLNQHQTKFNIPQVLSSWIDGVNDYIAMLDLSYQEYRNVDRVSGLDYPHTVAILKVIAQFHSISFAMKQQHPTIFEEVASKLQETYFDEKYRTWMERFYQRLFAVARDAIEKELPPLYLKKLNELLSVDVYGELCKIINTRDPLSIVTHGDLWIPNFLVKYQNNRPENVILIDFQLARYTSLAIDLVVFLLISVHIDVIEEHWDDLVILYHKTLSENFVKLGCDEDLVTLDALQAELGKHMGLVVAGSIEGLVMSMVDEEDCLDLDSIEGDEAVPLENVMRVHPFKEQEKRVRIAKMIKLAVDRNFI